MPVSGALGFRELQISRAADGPALRRVERFVCSRCRAAAVCRAVPTRGRAKPIR